MGIVRLPERGPAKAPRIRTRFRTAPLPTFGDRGRQNVLGALVSVGEAVANVIEDGKEERRRLELSQQLGAIRALSEEFGPDQLEQRDVIDPETIANEYQDRVEDIIDSTQSPAVRNALIQQTAEVLPALRLGVANQASAIARDRQRAIFNTQASETLGAVNLDNLAETQRELVEKIRSSNLFTPEQKITKIKGVQSETLIRALNRGLINDTDRTVDLIRSADFGDVLTAEQEARLRQFAARKFAEESARLIVSGLPALQEVPPNPGTPTLFAANRMSEIHRRRNELDARREELIGIMGEVAFAEEFENPLDRASERIFTQGQVLELGSQLLGIQSMDSDGNMTFKRQERSAPPGDLPQGLVGIRNKVGSTRREQLPWQTYDDVIDETFKAYVSPQIRDFSKSDEEVALLVSTMVENAGRVPAELTLNLDWLSTVGTEGRIRKQKINRLLGRSNLDHARGDKKTFQRTQQNSAQLSEAVGDDRLAYDELLAFLIETGTPERRADEQATLVFSQERKVQDLRISFQNSKIALDDPSDVANLVDATFFSSPNAGQQALREYNSLLEAGWILNRGLSEESAKRFANKRFMQLYADSDILGGRQLRRNAMELSFKGTGMSGREMRQEIFRDIADIMGDYDVVELRRDPNVDKAIRAELRRMGKSAALANNKVASDVFEPSFMRKLARVQHKPEFMDWTFQTGADGKPEYVIESQQEEVLLPIMRKLKNPETGEVTFQRYIFEAGGSNSPKGQRAIADSALLRLMDQISEDGVRDPHAYTAFIDFDFSRRQEIPLTERPEVAQKSKFGVRRTIRDPLTLDNEKLAKYKELYRALFEELERGIEERNARDQ